MFLILYKGYAVYKLLFRRPVYVLWRYIDLEFIFTNKFKDIATRQPSFFCCREGANEWVC